MSKICTIIPVYNEAQRLDKETFYLFLRNNPNQLLLFVNDGSSDDSEQILQQMAGHNPRQIKCLLLRNNQGKAEAVRQGVLHIKNWIEIDYFGYLDADLATPLSQISFICSYLDDNKDKLMAFGSRVKLLGTDINRKLSRHYLGRIFATSVSLLFDLSIYDTQCGAKYFRNNSDAISLFDEEFTSKWFFDVELFIRLRNRFPESLLENKAMEIALQNWQEQGNSKLKWSDFILSPWRLLRINRYYRR